ncbi:hypothetical protein INT45_003496 [Circinella minor]|uniref:Uncharacterized protein n=1 Tax=Circinella minor TaxID=1195481 RepID=A0A8H7S6K1_9FUNG|nr:hypothetical protein INT45_003496 [Circinella minor]
MLKNIDVGCYHGMVQGNRLIGLFKHSPKLHVINLRSFDEGALPAIHQYCPELTILTLNVDDYTDVIDTIMDRISTKAHGLRYLLLYNIVSGAIVKPFLETHQKTIEELELVLYSEQQQATAMTEEHGIGGAADDWAFLSTLDYMPNIHRLSIYARNSSPIQEHNLLSMLSKCPSLYFLSLECFVRHGITKETLKVIGSLQELNKLRISQCSLYAEATDDTNNHNGNNVDSNKMNTPKQLFGKLRNLTHVEIGYCSGTTHAVLDIVANIPNLMLIEVRGMSTTMNVDMQEIISKLATLEFLQQVEFDTVDLSPEALHEFDKDDVDSSMKQIVLRNIRNMDKFQAHQVLSSSNISIAYFGHDSIFENNTSGEDDL